MSSKEKIGKIAIIGAGFVGASIAYALTITDRAKEVILIDVDKKKAVGEVDDIAHGLANLGSVAIKAGEYTDCKDCDLIIVTAGRNRRPGESRLDMIKDNLVIIRDIASKMKPYYTKGAVLMVSNPVDILTYEMDKLMGLPSGRVFGMGCLLDSSRFTRTVAEYIGVFDKDSKCSLDSVKHCYILGEHGDSQVPVYSRITVCSDDGEYSLEDYCKHIGAEWDEEKKEELSATVKNMGASIISAKGRTHYGIATCVCAIADIMFGDKQSTLAVSSILNGEYGISDVAISVPCVLDRNGIKERKEFPLSDEELAALRESAVRVKEVIDNQ